MKSIYIFLRIRTKIQLLIIKNTPSGNHTDGVFFITFDRVFMND